MEHIKCVCLCTYILTQSSGGVVIEDFKHSARYHLYVMDNVLDVSFGVCVSVYGTNKYTHTHTHTLRLLQSSVVCRN